MKERTIRLCLFTLIISIFQFEIKASSVSVTLQQQDSLTLVALYQNTGGSGWSNKANWLSGKLNNWYGVKLSGGRVTNLNLSLEVKSQSFKVKN